MVPNRGGNDRIMDDRIVVKLLIEVVRLGGEMMIKWWMMDVKWWW